VTFALQGSVVPLRAERVASFDGRPLNVFSSALVPERPSVVLVLPFGVRHGIAGRLYAALAPHVNLVTWESRFVLDLEADASDTAFEAEFHVRDLVHVARHAGRALGDAERPVGVLGYCSGAGIGLLAAARHPRTVRRLALVSGEFVLPPAACKQTSFQREVDMLLPTAAKGQAIARSLFEKISASRVEAQSEFHDFVSLPFSTPDGLYRYGLNYVAYRQIDFLAAAREVRQPTLVVAARDDRQVTLESARIVRERLPNAAEVVAVDGDHYELCRANPRITAELVEFFSA
jgi:pimeloyl-ACP methyl ester carboxylesterase